MTSDYSHLRPTYPAWGSVLCRENTFLPANIATAWNPLNMHWYSQYSQFPSLLTQFAHKPFLKLLSCNYKLHLPCFQGSRASKWKSHKVCGFPSKALTISTSSTQRLPSPSGRRGSRPSKKWSTSGWGKISWSRRQLESVRFTKYSIPNSFIKPLSGWGLLRAKSKCALAMTWHTIKEMTGALRPSSLFFP